MSTARTILVTGATGSIGGGTALALARRGAKVVVLGRNAAKLNTLAERLRQVAATGAGSSSEAQVSTLEIDLSDMASVRRAAAEVLDRCPTIHGLVLSSATYLEGGPHVLASGHETMFATNVMGPFLLTQLLLPRLQESVATVLHVIATFNPQIDWDDLESLNSYTTWRAFTRSKVLDRALAGELARRYAGKVTSIAFDPTFIKADPGVAKQWPAGPIGFAMRTMSAIFAKRPAVAGEPAAELVLSSGDRSALNGALFKLAKRVAKPDPTMADAELGARLWGELERLTGVVVG